MMQIFSVFPELFFLSPFSAALLRVAAAYAFLYIANDMIRRRSEISAVRFPIVGYPSGWMVWTSALITALTAALLAIGLYTQVAALIGMIIAAKHGIGSLWFPTVMPLSRGTYAFLLVICVSVFVTGAGALAFDLPL